MRFWRLGGGRGVEVEIEVGYRFEVEVGSGFVDWVSLAVIFLSDMILAWSVMFFLRALMDLCVCGPSRYESTGLAFGGPMEGFCLYFFLSLFLSIVVVDIRTALIHGRPWLIRLGHSLEGDPQIVMYGRYLRACRVVGYLDNSICTNHHHNTIHL